METTTSIRNTTSSDPVEITKENQELRDLCCFLDDERKKSKRLAQEWQSFGKYTASVLRNEVVGFEKKISILQEKLQKLSQENAELRDLCLFLNQMSGMGSNTKGDTLKLDTPKVEPYATHAACVSDMKQVLGDVPQYTGFTGEEKLADNIQQPVPAAHESTSNDKIEEQQPESNVSYVSQLEKRLERLESEKLELVKSLSAAHILAVNANENKDLPNSTVTQETEVSEPPDIKAFLSFIKENGPSDHNGSNVGDPVNSKSRAGDEENKKKDFTPEEILKLSTLIEISKRLDAIETNSNSTLQAKEVSEIAILRMLITVAFKQIQSGDTSQYSESPVRSLGHNTNNTPDPFLMSSTLPSPHGVIRTEV